MNLYESTGKKLKRILSLLLPVLLPVAVCTAFFFCVNFTGEEALRKEKISLENALNHGAVHTYAITGAYPESLAELLDNYHIEYDREKFIVEYIPNGSNLLPSISVIILPSQKGGVFS